MATEKCANCGRVIATNEVAFLWQEKIVCAQCRTRLEAGGAAAPARPVPARIGEAYRRRPVFMAIATGIVAGTLVLLVAVAAAWMSWASSKTLHGIGAGLHGIGNIAAVVLPAAHGSIHGRIWWRSPIGAMHLGRDKTVMLVRRRVSGTAFHAFLQKSGAYAALTVPASQAARLRVAYRKAIAAYNEAGATYSDAQATYQAAVNKARATPNKAWTAYQAAANNARAAYHKARAAANEARATYENAVAATQLLNAQYPKRIGFISAEGICGRVYQRVNISVSLRKLFVVKKTKANFRGKYHFSKVAPGNYFFECNEPDGTTVILHYRRPIQVSSGQDVAVDIDLDKGTAP